MGIRQHCGYKDYDKLPWTLGRPPWSVQQWRSVSKNLTGNIVIIMSSTFERQLNLPGISTEAFAWHERQGAINRLIPPWENIDVVKTGDPVRVRLIKVDDQGRLDFSRKALIEKPEGYVERPKRPRSDSNRGGRKPFKKRRF